MTCCNGICAAAAHFDLKKAEEDLRRYQRYGPDPSTRMLLAELRRWPLEGLGLLDLGGGIGVIAVELGGAGLASVALADASAGYLEAARRHLSRRLRRRSILPRGIRRDGRLAARGGYRHARSRGLLLPGCGRAAPGSRRPRAQHGGVHLSAGRVVRARRRGGGKPMVPAAPRSVLRFRALAGAHGFGSGVCRICPHRRPPRKPPVGTGPLPPSLILQV